MMEHGPLRHELREQLLSDDPSDLIGVILVTMSGRELVLIAEGLDVQANAPDIQYLVDFEVRKKAVDKQGREWCSWDGIWWPCSK